MAETVVVVSHIEEFNSVLAKYFFENKGFREDFRSLCDELEKLEDFLYPTVHIALEFGAASNVCEAIFRMGSNVCNAIFRAHRMGRKIKKLNERITEIQARWLCPPCECSSENDPVESNSRERWDGIDAHQLERVYEALPDVLKLCVVYFSVFPKDIVIECEKLLHIWIAQGFVSGHVYILARLYIDELIDRRLIIRLIIQVSEDGGDGRVECCKFHNLLHDLAVSEFVKQTACLFKPGEQLLLSESLQLKSISESFFNNMAHLTVLDISQTDIRSLPKSIGKLKHLKFLNLFKTKILELPKSIGKLKHLKFLNLSKTEISELPKSIGKLKHLKFLNLSKTKISELPEDLSGLWRLQFLDVSHCSHLSKLHSGIGKQKCMLYLNVEGCGMLEQLPLGISELCLLHTLKGTLSDAGANAKALQLRDIKGLILLQHISLQINYLTAPSSEEGIFIQQEGIFGGMKKLRSLCIMNRGDYPFHLAKDTEVVEGLEMARLSKCVVPKWIFGLQNLVDLELELDHSDNYEGLEKAPNLKRLQLLCNYKCIEFPKQFGECMAFPKLEEFIIERFNSLEKFPLLNPTAMPRLKYFRLRWCDKLKNMIEGIENLRSLEEVEFLVDPQKAEDVWKGQWLQILKARQIKIIAARRDQSVIDAIVTGDIAILD